MHLLWSMGGKEREALGSKCIAGLQVVSWGLCEEGQRTDSKNTEEHVIVFKRLQRESRGDRVEVADKVVKGDRMILSLEVTGRRADGAAYAQKTSLPGMQSAAQGVCRDIEDLGPNSTRSSSSSSGSNGLVEPNIATGQVVKVTRSEVHLSLRLRPRRFVRYCALPYGIYLSVSPLAPRTILIHHLD